MALAGTAPPQAPFAMGDSRRKELWGLDFRSKGQDPDTDGVVRTPEADEDREKCRANFKYFYHTILAQTIRNRRTGIEEKQTLGRIHDYLIDFLNLDELVALRKKDPNSVYTKLVDLLPKQDRYGDYKERWLYWKTLDTSPRIQNGRSGPISDMFYNRFWQGVIIRIKGDGTTKCIMLPRGHLKSSIATQSHKFWRVIRDPSERHLIQTLTLGLAKDFINYIKEHCEKNEKFRRLFGHLVPVKRELPWNADFMSLRCKQRRGKEPTFRAAAMHSETTGGHTDEITLDDVVGKTNFRTPMLRQQTREATEHLQGVRDPGSLLTDIGTPWEEDDEHSLFVGKDEPLAEDTSFMVATILDADKRKKVDPKISPLGYGKPIYPEKFTPRAVQRIRKGIKNDRFFFGQYFLQFTGTGSRYFSQSWKQRYEGSPLTASKEHKLNIFIGIDTASGQEELKEADLCYTAALVLGQTTDRMNFYVLDGFNEKLTASEICVAIVDLGLKWKKYCAEWGGTFKAGVEKTCYTNFLHTALNYEKKLRSHRDTQAGVEPVTLSVTPLELDQRSKPERIRQLTQPYEMQCVYWPNELIVASRKTGSGAGSYDLISGKDMLEHQWDKYGPAGLPYVDLLDAHAWAYELAHPLLSKEIEPEKKDDLPADTYIRGMMEEMSESGISGVERWVKANRPPWK
jgi:hypothetical protein